jgi:catechol 2,3-dioxygenase-like lactoylglutathione lyase family enzyme
MRRGGAMAVLHFSHSGVCVSDIERSTAFDRDVFGFTRHHHLHLNGEADSTAVKVKDAKLDVVYLKRDVTLVEILHFAEPAPTRDAVPREMNRRGLTHFSFNVDEIAEVSPDVVAAGGRVMQETRVGTPNDKSCVFVTDPDGCLIELVKSPADPTPTPTT